MTTANTHWTDDEPDLEDDAHEAAPAAEPWTIDSEDRAAFAVDRILSLEEHLERVKTQGAKIEAEAGARLACAREFFEPQLATYYAEHPPTKGKTLRLRTGDLAVRTVRGGPRVRDAAQVVAWARDHLPAAIRVVTTEKVEADAIKQHVSTTGEIPPGVDVVPDEDRLYIKSPKGKE